MQCPECRRHAEPIFTIEISPKTHQRWRVERCPSCNHSYDLMLERDYVRKKNAEKTPPDKKQPPAGWMFGL